MMKKRAGGGDQKKTALVGGFSYKTLGDLTLFFVLLKQMNAR